MHQKTILSILLVLQLAVHAQESSVSIEAAPASDVISASEVSGAENTTSTVLEGEKKTSVKVEKVEVTGSHIKRLAVEGASPVQVIDRKEIDKTGYNSIADVLRDTSANSFGSTREQSGSNAAGVAHVNLRGLGSSNTLVLLNGQRMPSDAVTGAVDLNLIPMAAIERVEVLKDGASALYGSDALGGVVNVITRKNFNGSEVSLLQTSPQLPGGEKREISLVNGINTKKMNMVNVVYYRDNDLVFSRDREWTDNGYSATGDTPLYRNDGQTWKAGSGCPADQLVVLPSGEVCRYKFSDFKTELPQLEQLSAMSETSFDINSRLKLKARLGATQRKAFWSYAPAPSPSSGFTIPGSVADGLGPGGTPLPGATPGEDLNVRYRLVELGTRDTEVDSMAFNGLVGATIQTSDTWEVNVSTSHNRVDSSDRGVNGYALTDELVAAIESGQFNPFAPSGQKGSLENTRYVPVETTMSEITSLDVKATGEIGEISGGAVGLAIGSTITNQSYLDIFDEKSVNNEVFGNAGSSGGGGRSTQALYSEVSLPLTEKLEVQLAGRYDRYSDFGETTNPKASIMYKPVKTVLLRASAGTGFKAPLMQDLYAASSDGNPPVIDPTSCKREQELGGPTPSCNPQQVRVLSSGNKGLKEEKSVSYNVGAVFEPNRNFSFGVDAFLTKLNNKVGIDYDAALEAEAAGVDLSKYGVIVNRDANGYIEDIEAPLQNLAAQEVTGVDLTAGIREGKVRVGIDHSLLLAFREEGFPGTGLKDKLGENGMPSWRNSVTVGLSPFDRHELSLTRSSISGHKKAVDGTGSLPEFTSFDLQYTVDIRDFGVVTAGVKNLMAAIPPIDDSNDTTPLDTTLYDQIGRQVYMGVKAAF